MLIVFSITLQITTHLFVFEDIISIFIWNVNHKVKKKNELFHYRHSR